MIEITLITNLLDQVIQDQLRSKFNYKTQICFGKMTVVLKCIFFFQKQMVAELIVQSSCWPLRSHIILSLSFGQRIKENSFSKIGVRNLPFSFIFQKLSMLRQFSSLLSIFDTPKTLCNCNIKIVNCKQVKHVPLVPLIQCQIQ